MRRPAPVVVVGWFNMYATTGAEAFDFIVGDAVVLPREEERFYAERVVRVPTRLLPGLLGALSHARGRAAPCTTTGTVTFGAFCPHYKITEPMIAAWAAILQRAPGSRLLLKNRALHDKANRAALRDRFSRHRIPAGRIDFSGPAEHEAFLAAYGNVDIALDSFPYNGGTTTSEALWQGVPVLAFTGDRWASRTSASLLLAAGLSEWCMPDLASYIDRAVALAVWPSTPAMLASLRAAMRERLARSPVCDTVGLCRALERLYREAAIGSRKKKVPPGARLRR